MPLRGVSLETTWGRNMTFEEMVASVTDLISKGRNVAALSSCETALSHPIGPREKIRLLELKARALVAEDGRWGGPAISCLKEALELTEPDSDERARILCVFTAAYAALSSLGKVYQYRAEFMKLFSPVTGNKVRRRLYAHVEYNLALALHQVEDLDNASISYRRAMTAYEELQDSAAQPYIRDILISLIDIHQTLGDFGLAKSLMDQVFPQLSEEQFGALMRLRWAEHALGRRDPSSAVLLAESGLAHSSCDWKTRAALLLTRAKAARAMGDMDGAHDFALEALRFAALSHSTHLSDRVSRFLNAVSRGDEP